MLSDKISGMLVGGAVGDALGYPVEFMSYDEIQGKYGNKGITEYELTNEGIAEISDDTQMTLFTANGLLFGYTRLAMRGIMGNPASYIQDSYLEWLQTQTGDIDYTKEHYNWIRNIKQLHSRRAPGNTCMSALWDIALGKTVSNNSNGCGGIMRISPVAAYFRDDKNTAVTVAYDVANITHKHPLGCLPAALLSYILVSLLNEKQITKDKLIAYINEGIQLLREMYAEYNKDIDYLQEITQKAVQLSLSDEKDIEAINRLGEGWVAEETLAIAVFCSLRYINSFEQAVIVSVNHSGDSDSTGAVTGNIMGAILGYDVIPIYYKDNLELRWLIEDIANDLITKIPPVGEYADNYNTPQKRRWMEKYVDIVDIDRVPVKNSYVVDGSLRIYAGEYPGHKENNICRDKLSLYHSFYYFYDLTEEGELNPYEPFLESWQHYKRFPIRDCGVPYDTKSVKKLIEEIIDTARKQYPHGKTYIHCWGGVGRTGTIVGCLFAYLLKDKGLTPSDIYNKVMNQLNEHFSMCPKSEYRISPENETQRLFIQKFIENECV